RVLRQAPSLLRGAWTTVDLVRAIARALPRPAGATPLLELEAEARAPRGEREDEPKRVGARWRDVVRDARPVIPDPPARVGDPFGVVMVDRHLGHVDDRTRSTRPSGRWRSCDRPRPYSRDGLDGDPPPGGDRPQRGARHGGVRHRLPDRSADRAV